MGKLHEKTKTDAWYVYIVSCRDHSLYTGITKDLNRRILEHNSGLKGARYTRSRRPVALVYSEQATSRSMAASREHQLKRLKASWKHQLIIQSNTTPTGLADHNQTREEPHDIDPDC